MPKGRQSSVLNNVFKSAANSEGTAVSTVVLNRGATPGLAVKTANFYRQHGGVEGCVELPAPPPPDPPSLPPGPAPPEPGPEPEIIVNPDLRERPGITSKTTSVGKKLRLVDFKSFYGFDERAGDAALPWSPAMDPIRLVTGKLWTVYPSLHRVGQESNLFGRTTRFGSLPPSARAFRERYPGARREWIRPIDFTTTIIGNENLRNLYSELMTSSSTGVVPIFADLVEVGKITIVAGSPFRNNPHFNRRDPGGNAQLEGPSFRKFLFGGGRDFRGRSYNPGTFSTYLPNTLLEERGLLTAISRQQLEYGTYSDHSFEFSMPISSINLEHYGNIRKPLSAKIDPVYNFYCAEYENVLVNAPDAQLAEHTLPNIYTFLTEKFSKKKDYMLSANITNFLRLNSTRERREEGVLMASDRIKDFFVDKINSRVDSRGNVIDEKVGEASKGMSYFKKWAYTVDEMIRDRDYEIYKDTYSNYTSQIFPYEEDRLYLRLKEGKSSFPMLVDIKFSTDRTAPVADIIARTKTDCLLSEYILGDPVVAPLIIRLRQQAQSTGALRMDIAHDPQNLNVEYIEAKEFIITGAIPPSGVRPNTIVDSELYLNISPPRPPSNFGRRSYDFEEWIRSLEEIDNPDATSVIFGESESGMLFGNSEQQEMLPLLKAYLVAKVRNLIKEEGKFRKLGQVYNGKMCYNEALCYRIRKYVINPDAPITDREVLVSQYILPNKSDTDEIVFTDTQVKYNKPYIYKIDAVHFVIGNEYFYIFPHNIPGNGPSAVRTLDGARQTDLHYCNFPSVRIIETPYFNSHETDDVRVIARVVDAPPPPPMVALNAYKGISNRLLITANAGVGDFVQAPIIINAVADNVIIDNIRQSQQTELASLEKNDLTVEKYRKIRFRNDDIIRQFEIYRRMERPESYTDFSGNLHATMDTEGKVNSLALVDTIVPNTKYYYTFRSIDIHGYFSNPTCIYEVEMRYNEGLTYPIIRYYYPGEDIDTKVPTRDFQKFLEIRPLDDQLILNFEQSGLDGEKNITTPEGSERPISSLFPTFLAPVDESGAPIEGGFKEGNHFKLGDPSSQDLAWGRRFKIRLTSKHSGRKIDLNVKFDYKDLVKESDFYVQDE